MKAKENTNYAVIYNNEVTQIFSGNDIKEWNDDDIQAVEIPQGKEVAVGSKYDSITKQFVELNLDELKSKLLDSINFYFEREVRYLQGDVTQSEIDSYVTQLREAKEYQANPKASTPLLSQIAKERAMDIKKLVEKVLSKNAIYNEKIGRLIGHRQKLEKQIEAAKSKEELESIKYISPFINDKE